MLQAAFYHASCVTASTVLCTGEVEYVDLMKGMDGRPNGIAYVLFASASDAQEAVGTLV